MIFSARSGFGGKTPAAAEMAVAVLGLLWLTGLFGSPLPVHLSGQYGIVRWGIELLRVGICVVPVALLLRDPHGFASALRAIWPLLLLLLLAAASSIWSIRPVKTLLAAALLTTTTLFGVFLGTRFERCDQLRVIAAALGLAAIGSIVASLVFPELTVMRAENESDWMGLYRHKNLLARDMALAVPVFALLARDRLAPAHLAWAFAAASAGLIVASGSRTGALVATLATAATLLLSRAPGATRRSTGPWIAAGVALCAACAWFLPELLAILGRDVTLTGRTALWTAIVERIAARPWLGYGFDAFWVPSMDGGGPAIEVAQQIDWLARHAHNGFLDVVLDLGLLGLALFVAPLVAIAVRIVRDLRIGNRDRGRLWSALFLGYWILSNLTESPLVRQDQLGWALYVAVFVGAVRSRSAKPAA